TWIAFLEIHGDLRVGDPAPQRPHEAIEQEPDEHRDRQDAEGDDGGRAEPERLEAGRRQQQRQHRAGHHDDRSSQGEPHAPAIPDAADDVDELGAIVHGAALPGLGTGLKGLSPYEKITGTFRYATGDSRSRFPRPAAARRPPGDTTTGLAAVRTPHG